MIPYAAFFIVDINDKVLILRYKNGKNKGLFSGAGGHVEKYDKTLKAAAIRELEEETNIDYYKLDIIKEKQWTYNKEVKLFVIKVKKIPKITLSEEHNDYKKIKINNLHKYPLTSSFENSLSNNLKLLN